MGMTNQETSQPIVKIKNKLGQQGLSQEQIDTLVNEAVYLQLEADQKVLEALFEELDRIIHVPLPSTRLSNNFGVIIRESYQALKRKYLVD